MTPDVRLVVVASHDEVVPDLAVLDRSEQERAARFTVDHPRRVFITARAALRRTLGKHLGRDPSTLSFALGPHGKPDLDPPSSLKFNLSHSGDTIVIALVEGIDIGVDVEELSRTVATGRLAQRFFTEREAYAVNQATESERNRVFFHCWTAKEAVLKATGSGLTVPVREVEVDPDPDALPRIVALGGDPERSTGWTLLRHEVPGRWIATIALRGTAQRVLVEPAG